MEMVASAEIPRFCPEWIKIWLLPYWVNSDQCKRAHTHTPTTTVTREKLAFTRTKLRRNEYLWQSIYKSYALQSLCVGIRRCHGDEWNVSVCAWSGRSERMLSHEACHVFVQCAFPSNRNSNINTPLIICAVLSFCVCLWGSWSDVQLLVCIHGNVVAILRHCCVLIWHSY